MRDTLRSDDALRDEYAAVKRRAGKAAADIDEYSRLKGAMVQSILAAGGMPAGELNKITANQVPSHRELPR